MSLAIEIVPVGQMSTNCYLVWDSETKEGLVLDPGFEGDYISQKILELEIKPQAILLTHGHFDHCLGLLEVKLNFRVPVYLNKADAPLFKKARSSSKRFLKFDPGPIPPLDRDLKQGQEINFGKQKLFVLETPGHTPGSVTFTNGVSIAFTGDTLFKDGIGRTDFSYSNANELKESLGRIFELPGWCKIYPGHGELSTLKAESLNFPG